MYIMDYLYNSCMNILLGKVLSHMKLGNIKQGTTHSQHTHTHTCYHSHQQHILVHDKLYKTGFSVQMVSKEWVKS